MNHDDPDDNPWGGDWSNEPAQKTAQSSQPHAQQQPHHQPPPGAQQHQPPPGAQQHPPQGQMQSAQGHAYPAQKDSASGLAIATLIAGVAGWTLVPIFGSIAAVIMGFIEWNNIKSGQSSEQGKIMVMIGMGLGGAGLALYVLGCLFFFLPFFCLPLLAV